MDARLARGKERSMENCMFYATRDTSTSTARSRSRIQRTPRMWCRVRLSLTLNSLAGFNRALAPRVHTGRAGNRVFATARDTTEVAGNPAANRKRSPQRRDREYHREKEGTQRRFGPHQAECSGTSFDGPHCGALSASNLGSRQSQRTAPSHLR